METHSEYSELIENPTPRCSCMLVLDVSYSMLGNPIEELNAGVVQFINEVMEDDFAAHSVELGVISFGGSVKTEIPITPISQVSAPTFEANGNTPMGEAVEKAIDLLNESKSRYKSAGVSYYQPWLVLMSDGAPTDYYKTAASKLKQLGDERKILVFGIGIGDRCDLNILSDFCPSSRPPKKLKGLQFKEFFSWLSQSMARVSVSTPGTDINLPSTGGWESIQV